MQLCIKLLAASRKFFYEENYNQNKPLIQSREAEKERRLSFKLKKEELYMTENIITSRKSDKAEASLWNSSKKRLF